MQRTEPRLILETRTPSLCSRSRLTRSCMTILITANRPIHSWIRCRRNESVIIIAANRVLKNKTNTTATGLGTNEPTSDIVSLSTWHLSMYRYLYTMRRLYILCVLDIIKLKQPTIYEYNI